VSDFVELFAKQFAASSCLKLSFLTGPVAIPVAIFFSHSRTKATSPAGSATCSGGTLRAAFKNVRKYVTASAVTGGEILTLLPRQQ